MKGDFYFIYSLQSQFCWKFVLVKLKGFGGIFKFVEFLVPQQLMFYCIFTKEFSKTFEMGSFRSEIFFEKFPYKIFEIFSKSKKIFIKYSN